MDGRLRVAGPSQDRANNRIPTQRDREGREDRENQETNQSILELMTLLMPSFLPHGRNAMPIDPSTRDRIFAAAEQLTDPLTRTVSEMVRINTVNPYSGDDTAGSEKPGQLYLQDQLRAAGFATRLFEPPPDVYQQGGIIGPAGRSWKDRPNLVGELTLEIAKPLPLDGGGWPAAGGPGEGDGRHARLSSPSPLPLSHQGRGVRDRRPFFGPRPAGRLILPASRSCTAASRSPGASR